VKAAAAIVITVAIAMFLAAPSRRPVIVARGPMEVPAGVEVVGSLREAGLVVAGNDVYIHDLTIDGNRDETEVRQGLPPWNRPFTGFTVGNGIVIDGRRHVTIRNVTLRNIAGFAILVARSHDITIDHVRVENSGSRNADGRNNTTGGILIEEGSADFRVTNCQFREILGNGIWTHSLYTSPRNARGLIANNRFETIGRDAIQVGHATEIQVLDNIGWRIGYPLAEVDATPVAVDTAGNVDRSIYAGNRFATIEGKCIDLDGFHDGEVRGNACVNLTGYGIVMNNTNPDMQSSHIRVVDNLVDSAGFGGIFVIGHDNLVARNRLLDLNRSHQGDPLLRSGIYLGDHAERSGPAKGNVIEDNTVTGFQMQCIGGAPTISPDWNTVRRNTCK
jgi:hypothetical protein